MRAGRLLAELLHLQQRGGITAAELADEMEVSVRTIYRDVAELQAAGVPIWTETGPNGGIRLVEGWRTTLDGLTSQEADALFLAGAPHAVAQLGLGTVLAAAQTKVLATLPPELRGRAGRVRERFHLDAPGWFHRDEDQPHLATVATAVWDGHRIEIDYARADRTVARRLDPLGLVLKAGSWYLVARHRGSARTYRLSRIRSARSRDEPFTRPDDFDLADWWASSAREFDRSILHDSVRLRLSPRAARRLPSLVDGAAADEALAAAGSANEDGWRTIELAVESEAVALDQLIGLGAGVEVLAPRSLRKAFAEVGAAMARQNSSAGRARSSGGRRR